MKKLLYVVDRIGIHENRFCGAMTEEFDVEILALNESVGIDIDFDRISRSTDLIVAGPLSDPISRIPIESQTPILGICYASEINEVKNIQEIQRNISRCAAIVTDSDYTRNRLRKNFKYDNPIYETKYGCDWADFARYQPTFQENPSIIVLRNWRDLYCNEVILAALEVMHENGIPFNCTFVGAGPELASGKSLARKYGIQDKVTFLGKIENHDLPELMSQHWMYISAAKSDGTSISLLEALSMGMICLTTNFPTNNFIEEQVIGINFETGSKFDLVEKILYLNSLSSREKSRMSSNARSYGKKEARWSENSKVLIRAIHQTIKYQGLNC
jgi:glycosyltransferase involved in cell wall biosynthesis